MPRSMFHEIAVEETEQPKNGKGSKILGMSTRTPKGFVRRSTAKTSRVCIPHRSSCQRRLRCKGESVHEEKTTPRKEGDVLLLDHQ